MRRDVRRRAEAKAHRRSIALPLVVGALLLAGVVAFYQVGTRAPETDDRLCPKATGPVGATVLLLDASDPLTPKHRAELERLAGQIVSEHAGRMGIAPGELLAVYELTQDPGAPKQLIEVCRPFRRTRRIVPGATTSTRGRRFDERDWEQFRGRLLPAGSRNAKANRSRPPRCSKRSRSLPPATCPANAGMNGVKVHLVVFSDLLQHSPRFSHYGPYPDARDMRHRARDLLTDLTGAQVSLFRLERQKYAKWQTERHYYWWTELVQEQGGQIEWQESI